MGNVDRDLEAESFPIELELDREQQYIASNRTRICLVKTCTRQAKIAHGGPSVINIPVVGGREVVGTSLRFCNGCYSVVTKRPTPECKDENCNELCAPITRSNRVVPNKWREHCEVHHCMDVVTLFITKFTTNSSVLDTYNKHTTPIDTDELTQALLAVKTLHNNYIDDTTHGTLVKDLIEKFWGVLGPEYEGTTINSIRYIMVPYGIGLLHSTSNRGEDSKTTVESITQLVELHNTKVVPALNNLGSMGSQQLTVNAVFITLDKIVTGRVYTEPSEMNKFGPWLPENGWIMEKYCYDNKNEAIDWETKRSFHPPNHRAVPKGMNNEGIRSYVDTVEKFVKLQHSFYDDTEWETLQDCRTIPAKDVNGDDGIVGVPLHRFDSIPKNKELLELCTSKVDEYKKAEQDGQDEIAEGITKSFYSGENVRMLLEVKEEEEGGEEDGSSNEEEGGKDDDLSKDSEGGDVESKDDEFALSMDESSEENGDMEGKEDDSSSDEGSVEEDDSSGEEYDKAASAGGRRTSLRVAALEKKKKKKKKEEKKKKTEEEDEEEEAAEEEVDKQRFYVLEKEMVETIVVHAIMQQILGVTRKYNSTKEEEKGNDSIKEIASFFDHLNNIAVEDSEEGKKFVETCNDIANDGDVEGDSLKEKLTTLIKSHHNRLRK